MSKNKTCWDMAKASALAIVLCLAGFGAQSALGYPDPYYFQDFDTWTPEQTVFGNYTFNGWLVSNGVIRPKQGFAWPYDPYSIPNMSALNAPLANGAFPRYSVMTPLMTNGAGLVSFYYRTRFASPNNTFEVQSSTDYGATWVTNATIADATLTWTYYQVDVNVYDDTYIRIEKTGDGNTSQHYLMLEDINVSLPYAYADISDVTLSPNPALTETPLVISARLVPQVYGSNLAPAVVYTTNSWVTSAVAGMVNTGGFYWATSPGIPGMNTPGLTVEYYIDVELDGPTTNNTHSYWPAGAPASTSNYLVRARPFTSSYPNMDVIGPASTNMALQSDYVWRGVTEKGSYVTPSFYFESGASTWGDTNQSSTLLPLSGLADASSTIDLTGTITNYLEFTFNETATNSAYFIQPCEYVHFDTWTGATTFGTRSNSDGWQMVDARTTTGAETNKAFLNAGMSCVLRGASNGSIRTPFLSQGLGTLNFRYRNWADDGSVKGQLSIEKSLSGASWIPVDDIQTILTPDYVYVSVGVADDVNRYLRIVNGSSNITDFMCVDNISASPPGALVKLSDGTNSLTPTEAGQIVPVQVDFLASGGATNLECKVYWKSVDATGYSWDTMTATGNTFYGQIPPSLAGTVEYYFECEYDGFNAAPVQFPDGGPTAPLSFTAVANVPSYRFQDFDTWTPIQTVFGTYTYGGWTVSNGVIRPTSGFTWPYAPYSAPNMAALNAPLDTGAFPRYSVISPILTGGCSAVSFYYRTRYATPGCDFEIQTSSDGGATWSTNTSMSDAALDWTNFSFDLDVYGDVILRIEKTSDSNTAQQYFFLEDIICAPPSSDVLITNVYLTPGYPGTADTVQVYCDIFSRDVSFRAFDLRPKLVYRPANGVWTTNAMNLTAVNNGTNSFVASIPPQPPDTVEYFFRCDFAGYYFTNSSLSAKRSPAFLPDASATNEQPSSFFEYVPRRFLSQYDSVSVSSTVGTASMSLVGDTTWQGVFDAPGTTQMLFNFAASGYFTGGQIDLSTNFFGDGLQVFSDPPFSGYSTTGGPAVTVNIDTSSLSQVVFFFNPSTGYYEVRRGAYEDFDEWLADPNYFANSLNLADIVLITNTFNSWPQNFDYVTVPNKDLEDFQYLILPQANVYFDYFSGSLGPSNWTYSGYYIEDGKLASGVGVDSANNSFQSTSPGLGSTGPQAATLPDGMGWISWKARCRYEDNYYTWYTNGFNWTNYEVTATMYGSDAAGWPTLTLYAYYQNPSNYYECVVQQTNYAGTTARLHLGIYRVRDGARSRRGYRTINGTVSNAMDVTFRVSTENARVRLSAKTNPGGSIWGGWNESWSDSDGLRLTEGGSIGLRTDDVKMVADDITVSPWLWNTFDGIDNQPWTAVTNRADWYFENCRLDDNDVYLTNNVTGYIRSPYIPTTPTYMRIRHYYYSDGGPLTSTFTVQGSPDGSGWTDINTFETTNNTWREPIITSGFGTYKFLRIRNDDGGGNPGRIRFSWVHIDADTPFYTEDFSDGIADDWQDDSGYWVVNNQKYERRAYCGPVCGIDIQTKYVPGESEYPTWGPGDTYKTYVLPSNNQWQAFYEDFKFWDSNLFYRVRHTTGPGNVRFDDLTMSSWRAKNYEVQSNGWAMTEGWVTEQTPGDNQVELWRSRANPTNAQTIRSEKMTNGVGVIEFDYDFSQMNGSNATFNIEYDYLTNGTWPIIHTQTVAPTDPLPAKFYLNISTSEPWFVRIRHTTTNETTIMEVDNFKISDYRPRDDRTWEAYNAKITSLEDIREFEPAYQPEDEVRTAYLNNSATNDTLNGAIYSNSYPYIQSARVNEGIGRVSFWYRAWETDGNPPGNIALYASASETEPMSNWTQLASLNVDNTYYKLYQNDFYVKDKYFLRLTSDTNGSGRVSIDNMLVAQPLAADFDVRLIEVNPTVPLDTDTVNFAAELNRFVLAPSNINAKLYYQIGTNDWGNLSGTWDTNNNVLDMTLVASSPTNMRFETTSALPAQGIDTIVQYYIECTFDGVFSSVTSPKKGRTFTNPSWYSNINLNVGAPITNPYYIVYSCPPDSVWINEFNYYYFASANTNEFVEIAGQAGKRIANWRVELVNAGYSKYGDYAITNIATIPDDTGNGFGFWVLGDAGLAPDSVFTNAARSPEDMADVGGIRLVRSSGIWEDCVSYGVGGASLTGFVYTAAKTFANNSPIRLTGYGEVATDFTWSWDGSSPITIADTNVSQYFEYAVPPPPTYSITISNFWTTSSNTYIVSVSDHTNQIEITPWYCTNLIDTNWIAVTGISETYTPSSGTYTQWFDNVTNAPAVFYKVSSTNDP